MKRHLPSLWLCGVLSLSVGCQPETDTPELKSRAEALSGEVGAWTATSPKTDGTPGTSAVVLRGTGEVLAANYGFVQRYDPYANTWRSTNQQCTPGYCLTRALTELPSGEVLAEILGPGRGATSGMQKYNPGTDVWSTVSVQTYRNESLTVLDSGKVLIAGGFYYQGIGAIRVKDSLEYDPATGTSTPSNTLATPRSDHTATRLYSGQVLVTGGIADSGSSLASAELYDPSTKSWSSAGAMSKSRAGHKAVRLYSGSVLVLGDTDDSVDLYDPFNAVWSVGPTLPFSAPTAATLLYSGEVLVTNNAGQAAVYSPYQNVWLPAPSAASATATGASVLLQSGKVMRFNGSSPAAEVFTR